MVRLKIYDGGSLMIYCIDFKINANYANFGNIPYGQSLVSPIPYCFDFSSFTIDLLGY